jgi:hypothetical protein
MRRPRAPLFLARRAYRQRRLMDAARLLPLVGLFLFLLPIFWQPARTEAADTAPGGLYIFIVWALLIAGCGAIAARLDHEGGGAGDDGQETP